jgi:hypothetical protein
MVHPNPATLISGDAMIVTVDRPAGNDSSLA